MQFRSGNSWVNACDLPSAEAGRGGDRGKGKQPFEAEFESDWDDPYDSEDEPDRGLDRALGRSADDGAGPSSPRGELDGWAGMSPPAPAEAGRGRVRGRGGRGLDGGGGDGGDNGGGGGEGATLPHERRCNANDRNQWRCDRERVAGTRHCQAHRSGGPTPGDRGPVMEGGAADDGDVAIVPKRRHALDPSSADARAPANPRRARRVHAKSRRRKRSYPRRSPRPLYPLTPVAAPVPCAPGYRFWC